MDFQQWKPRYTLTGALPVWQPPCVLHRLTSVALVAGLLGACGTVEVGDNFIPPDRNLDEDFFFCEIQPRVITAQGCASGAAGEAGDCHSSRSALRLSRDAELAAPPTCVDGVPTTQVPISYEDNLEAIRFTVQVDPLSSPLYRRPLQLDSHPRRIFDASSVEANLL
ncbi:MAG: hypothetical protein H5U40_02495, partial [Polyangiaceae bacterium]|nr:hypothetical protein [Polyangiaceae bacterium]